MLWLLSLLRLLLLSWLGLRDTMPRFILVLRPSHPLMHAGGAGKLNIIFNNAGIMHPNVRCAQCSVVVARRFSVR